MLFATPVSSTLTCCNYIVKAFKESRAQEKGCYIISFPLEEKKENQTNKNCLLAYLACKSQHAFLTDPHLKHFLSVLSSLPLTHQETRFLLYCWGYIVWEVMIHYLESTTYVQVHYLEHPELKQGSPCSLHAASCILTLGCARKVVLRIPTQGPLPVPGIT